MHRFQQFHCTVLNQEPERSPGLEEAYGTPVYTKGTAEQAEQGGAAEAG